MRELRRRIEAIRRARGLSRRDLAQRLAVSVQTVFNIERRQEYNLTTDMMGRLEDALSIRFKIEIEEDHMTDPKIIMGSDAMILHIRKGNTGCSMPNDQLGSKIRDWMYERGANLLEENAESYWGKEGDFVAADKLPKTSAQWEFERSRLPELYTYLESL